MVRSWSSGSPRTISPPTAPQPKPSTESCIPVRPNTRISIAVPPPARVDRARYSNLRRASVEVTYDLDAQRFGQVQRVVHIVFGVQGRAGTRHVVARIFALCPSARPNSGH